MADQHNTTNTTPEPRGSNSGLAFIVGALVVAVAVLGYIFLVEDADDGGDLNISVEGAGDAGESVGEAVEGAADAVEGAADEATDGN